MDANYFIALFELILRDVHAGKRIYDARAAPYRHDEWWTQDASRGSAATARNGADAGVCTAGGECEGETCGR